MSKTPQGYGQDCDPRNAKTQKAIKQAEREYFKNLGKAKTNG